MILSMPGELWVTYCWTFWDFAGHIMSSQLNISSPDILLNIFSPYKISGENLLLHRTFEIFASCLASLANFAFSAENNFSISYCSVTSISMAI